MAKFVLKAVISATLIWWLLSGIEISQITEPLSRVSLLSLALGIGLLLLGSLIGAWRWKMIITAWGGTLGFWRLWSHVLVGVFFNQTLPSSIGGDAVRILRVKREGLSLQMAVNSVIVDRATGLAGLIILVAFGQILSSSETTDPMLRMMLSVLSVAGTLAFLVAALLDKIPLPARMLRWRWLAALAGLSQDFRRVFMDPRQAAMLLLSATAMQITIPLAVYAISRSLTIPVGLIDHLILVPPAILILVLPISIAGWGVREAALVYAFAFVGVAKPEAFAVSVLFGIIVIFSGLPGAVLWLASGWSAKSRV